MNALVFLSEEDQQLLIHLHQHIYLDVDYMMKRIYKGYSRNTIYVRLRRLVEANYLKQETLPMPSVRGKKAKAGRPLKVYTLAKVGVEMVRELRGSVHWNKRWSERVATFVYHSLMLADVEASMSIHSEQETSYELKEWINEARATYKYTKSAKDILRPDGIAVVGVKGRTDRNAGLLLEMERSYSTKDVLLKKILRYNDFFKREESMLQQYDRHVGFDYPLVLWKLIFIARDEVREKELLRHLRDAEHPPVYEIEQNGEMVYKERYSVLITTFAEITEQPFGAIYRELSDPTVKIKI
ncbi:replication-relaxation family protein [Bacillus thuringiensis]|uniref:replication-relaxation family protein n=1 Tax=Bacillus thuringiensis TaxID=1428 RepID=UPI0021B46191|nr:replication-relaxation family protein [Bacillus thuringiensis]